MERLEHRLILFVSAKSLGPGRTSYRTVVELVGARNTDRPPKVRTEWDQDADVPPTRVSDADLAALPLKPDKWHGEWNYAVKKPKASAESLLRHD